MNWRAEIQEWQAAGATSAFTAFGGALLAAALSAAVPIAHSQEASGQVNFAARFAAETAILLMPMAMPVATTKIIPDPVPAVPPLEPASPLPPADPSSLARRVDQVAAAGGDLCERHHLRKVWISSRRWRCR